MFRDFLLATFQPKALDTLKPEFVPLIGKKIKVMYSWTVDEGVYAGQKAYHLLNDEGSDYSTNPFGWFPEEDLIFDSL